MWIVFLIIYGILIGFYTVLRRKATEKSDVLFVLALSSTIGFLLISWGAGEAFSLHGTSILMIFVKSILISFSWIFELLAFKKYYISSLQPISSIKVAISFIASIIIFSEPVFWWRFIGVAIIFTGLILLNYFDKYMFKKKYRNLLINKVQEKNSKENVKTLNKYNGLNHPTKIIKHTKFYQYNNQTKSKANVNKNRIQAIIFFIISCVCSETSAILDKIILNDIAPTQMQFWYMFFIALLLWCYIVIKCIKQKRIIIKKSDWKNWLIYLIAFILIIADQLLFRALSQPDVLVSGVSILKQISGIVAIIFGGILYKEPNLKYKFIFITIILVGIVVVIV